MHTCSLIFCSKSFLLAAVLSPAGGAAFGFALIGFSGGGAKSCLPNLDAILPTPIEDCNWPSAAGAGAGFAAGDFVVAYQVRKGIQSSMGYVLQVLPSAPPWRALYQQQARAPWRHRVAMSLPYEVSQRRIHTTQGIIARGAEAGAAAGAFEVITTPKAVFGYSV